jgi:hypothetical protein
LLLTKQKRTAMQLITTIQDITNKIINSRYSKHIYLLAIILISTYGIAHAADPDPIFDADAPVDGGLSLLIAGAIGYGVKKIKNNRKRNSC